MIMEVLSVTCRFSQSIGNQKSCLPNFRLMSNEKRYIFRELNNVTLRKVMDFCYNNTAYSCTETDDCYYCRIIDYIKDEFRSRTSEPGYCVILHEGKRECKCFHSCSSNDNLHYNLM